MALTEACDLPILVYNVPSRTVTDILPETLARVAALPNVIGIKDACGNLARCSAHRALCGADFILLSGNDDMALGFNAMGGTGCISVSANVAPRLCADFQNACRDGRWDDALALNDRLYPLHAALFTRRVAGPDQICAEPDQERLSRRPPPADDAALGEASRRAVDAALEHAGLA